jgi:hypothetical protein
MPDVSFMKVRLGRTASLVSEKADHARLIPPNAEIPDRDVLRELLPSARCRQFLCLAFSGSRIAFPLFCFCRTGIRLFYFSRGVRYLLSLRLRFGVAE